MNPVLAAWGAAAVVEGAIVESGPYPGELKRQPIRLRVDTVYKGAPMAGAPLDVGYLHCNTAPVAPDPTRPSIWFLLASEEGLWTHLCLPYFAADEDGRARVREAVRLSARVTPAREPGAVDPNTPVFVLRLLALGWRLAALEEEVKAASRDGTTPPDGTALFDKLRDAVGVGYAFLPGPSSPDLLRDVVGRVGWGTYAGDLLLYGSLTQQDWHGRPPKPADDGSAPANPKAAARRRAIAAFIPVWGDPGQVEPLLRAVCTALADAPCDGAGFDPNVR